MLELFNEMPRDLLHTGKNSNRWFTSEGFYFTLFFIYPFKFSIYHHASFLDSDKLITEAALLIIVRKNAVEHNVLSNIAKFGS